MNDVTKTWNKNTTIPPPVSLYLDTPHIRCVFISLLFRRFSPSRPVCELTEQHLTLCFLFCDWYTSSYMRVFILSSMDFFCVERLYLGSKHVSDDAYCCCPISLYLSTGILFRHHSVIPKSWFCCNLFLLIVKLYWPIFFGRIFQFYNFNAWAITCLAHFSLFPKSSIMQLHLPYILPLGSIVMWSYKTEPYSLHRILSSFPELPSILPIL
jgi:hypothetical protein